MGIMRELDKEFPAYYYSIYTTSTWFMLTINSPIPIFMY